MRSCRGSGAKAKVRPIPGNAPHDRLVSRGTQSPRSVCDDPFPVTPFLQLQRTLRPQRAFFKAWRNLSGPMGFQNQKQKQKQKQNQTLGRDQTASRWSAPHPGKRTRREDHALSHRPQMSSGRLFLDRVARQHCPSPLHRHRRITCTPRRPRQKATFLLCQGTRHFYFALTRAKKIIANAELLVYTFAILGECDGARRLPKLLTYTMIGSLKNLSSSRISGHPKHTIPSSS